MAQTTTVRVTNNRPLKIRRLLQFNNSTSLGLVIPKSIVKKLDLKAGEYMSCEINAAGTSISLNKCSLEMPGFTNAGDEEDKTCQD